MHGDPIAELNEGLRIFKTDLMSDSLAVKRVEVAIITFGPVKVVSEFQTADNFDPPQLTTTGDTPMGAAIMEAMRLVEDRKQVYKDHCVPYSRPWIFLITDGAPTDDVRRATTALREGVRAAQIRFLRCGRAGCKYARACPNKSSPTDETSGIEVSRAIHLAVGLARISFSLQP